jgi:RNA methyltransferase, TrmH family
VLTRAQVRLLRRITTRRGREAEGQVLLEGPRVISTALERGATITFALRPAGDLAASPGPIIEQLARAGVEVDEVSQDLFEEFADTETPQGILAVARRPVAPFPPGEGGPEPGFRCLVLDGIQDPGNVGTLVRSAAALGVASVVALDGTADPWGPRAIRASAGAAFSLPIHSTRWESLADWLDRFGVRLFIADGAGRDVREWLKGGTRAGVGETGSPVGILEHPWALLVGSEGAGARMEAREKAEECLAIPVTRGVESLNVAAAAAILLWALGEGGEAMVVPKGVRHD